MRYATRTLGAALVAAGATVAVALLSANRLADAPVRGRLAGPDALGTVASLTAIAVGLAAFIWLGRSIGPETKSSRPALIAGAVGGGLTGLAGGLAQALALADYLGLVLLGYAVPPEFLTVALGAYVVLATAGAAVVGAAITYLAWDRAPGRRLTR